MTKNDLRSGMWVKDMSRTNEYGIVIINDVKGKNFISYLNDGTYMELDSFNNNLIHNYNEDYSISEVYSRNPGDSLGGTICNLVLWSRDSKVKITCEGKSVEISKESAKALNLI